MTERDRFIAYCRRRFAEMRAEYLAANPERAGDPTWTLYRGLDYGVGQGPGHNMLCSGVGCTTMGSVNADS